jgi:hypothetical protein
MSYAFITSLKKNPRQSYVQLLNSIRDELANGKYAQKPQLSCSHPLGEFSPPSRVESFNQLELIKLHRHKPSLRYVNQ